ncbi:FLUCTUATING-LIGHT-ACCLIMATION protein 1, chloroplastic-like isoform X2 [Apium graveolens]
MLHPYLGQLMMSKRRGSVFFFQVAVSDKEHTLRKRLKKLAENADVSTLNGLNYVLKEVVKALLQYNDSSIHFTKLCSITAPMMQLRKWFEEFLNRELRMEDVEYTLLNTLVNADDDGEHKDDDGFYWLSHIM